MFDPTSRYNPIPTATLTVTNPDGTTQTIRYVRRRIIPSPIGTTTLLQYTVQQGDRLDNIAARYVGDPTQFWKICDVDNVLSPNELTDQVGRSIRIAVALR